MILFLFDRFIVILWKLGLIDIFFRVIRVIFDLVILENFLIFFFNLRFMFVGVKDILFFNFKFLILIGFNKL